MNAEKKFTKIPTESSFWPWCVFTNQSTALNAQVALYLLKVVLWNGWNAYFDFPEAFLFFFSFFFALWAEWKYPASSSLAEFKKKKKKGTSRRTPPAITKPHTHTIKWVQSTNLAVVKKIPRGAECAGMDAGSCRKYYRTRKQVKGLTTDLQYQGIIQELVPTKYYYFYFILFFWRRASFRTCK